MNLMQPRDENGEIIDLSLYSPTQRTNIRMYGLEHKDWTPQDVTDYRTHWMSQTPTRIIVNRDKHAAAKWVQANLHRHRYKLTNSGPYEISIYFEREEDAVLFKLAV